MPSDSSNALMRILTDDASHTYVRVSPRIANEIFSAGYGWRVEGAAKLAIRGDAGPRGYISTFDPLAHGYQEASDGSRLAQIVEAATKTAELRDNPVHIHTHGYFSDRTGIDTNYIAVPNHPSWAINLHCDGTVTVYDRTFAGMAPIGPFARRDVSEIEAALYPLQLRREQDTLGSKGAKERARAGAKLIAAALSSLAETAWGLNSWVLHTTDMRSDKMRFVARDQYLLPAVEG